MIEVQFARPFFERKVYCLLTDIADVAIALEDAFVTHSFCNGSGDGFLSANLCPVTILSHDEGICLSPLVHALSFHHNIRRISGFSLSIPLFAPRATFISSGTGTVISSQGFMLRLSIGIIVGFLRLCRLIGLIAFMLALATTSGIAILLCRVMHKGTVGLLLQAGIADFVSQPGSFRFFRGFADTTQAAAFPVSCPFTRNTDSQRLAIPVVELSKGLFTAIIADAVPFSCGRAGRIPGVRAALGAFIGDGATAIIGALRFTARFLSMVYFPHSNSLSVQGCCLASGSASHASRSDQSLKQLHHIPARLSSLIPLPMLHDALFLALLEVR